MTSSLLFVLDAWVFAVGAVVGSFANVCIHRLPRGESVVFPPSRCPSCRGRIAPWDNVPVLSWLLLRGRCRACRAPISPRYPLVEAATGLLFLLARWQLGFSPEALAGALLLAACLVLAAIDLESRLLPDEVTLGGALLALALAAGRDLLFRPAGEPLDPGSSLALLSIGGALFGALLLWGVREAYRLFRGAEGMGLGDVKMIAMVGAFLGPAGVFVTLFFASLAGAALGLAVAAGRWVAFAKARRDAASGGRPLPDGFSLRLDADGRVAAASRRWTEIPGAAAVGEPARGSGPLLRPLVAFLRLARSRAARGLESAHGRLVVDDGEEFFRVLAARAVTVRGELFVQLARADIPFGVFLAAGAALALLAGRAFLVVLLGDPTPPGAGLLP